MNRKRKEEVPGDELGTIMGTATGESEHCVAPGGWAGTDDATSTALSDQLGDPPMPEEDKPFGAIARDFDEEVQKDDEQQTEAALRNDAREEQDELAEKRRAAIKAAIAALSS